MACQGASEAACDEAQLKRLEYIAKHNTRHTQSGDTAVTDIETKNSDKQLR